MLFVGHFIEFYFIITPLQNPLEPPILMYNRKVPHEAPLLGGIPGALSGQVA
jgi:hypothetical protein